MKPLKSREEYEKFEDLLDAYLKTRGASGGLDSSKLTIALFDLQITYAFMTLNVLNVGGVWNNNLAHYFHTNQFETLSILDDPNLFMTKMDVLNNANACVFRARSFWDKFMGFLTLYLAPDMYENFIQTKSRRRFFRKQVLAKLSTVPFPFQHA